jgi:hypothetical protein
MAKQIQNNVKKNEEYEAVTRLKEENEKLR